MKPTLSDTRNLSTVRFESRGDERIIVTLLDHRDGTGSERLIGSPLSRPFYIWGLGNWTHFLIELSGRKAGIIPNHIPAFFGTVFFAPFPY